MLTDKQLQQAINVLQKQQMALVGEFNKHVINSDNDNIAIYQKLEEIAVLQQQLHNAIKEL